MMYWMLTKQEARESWLLTGWAAAARGVGPDTKITPYIEYPFADEAKLIEFLRINGHPVTSSQSSTALWLIGQGIRKV